MKFKIAKIFLFLIPLILLAEPYNSPTIDGTISVSPDDWDSTELVVEDPNDDSYWGTTNDFHNIWLTWDANFLYLGLEFTVSDNAMIVYIETGISGGVSDFNSTRGYSGAYPRNITFPDSIGIDLMVADWNGATPSVFKISDSSSAEITSSCLSASGDSYQQEIAIPWNTIYPDAENIVLDGARLKIVGVIAGGDNYGACDAAPDNASVDGGEGPHLLDNLITIAVDSDSDGIPDYSGSAVSGTVSFDDTMFAEPPYPVASVEAYISETSELFATANSSSDDGSYLLAGLQIDSTYDFIASANGFIPDTVRNYLISADENILNFTLEPYRGMIYGTISPSDFSTIIYATDETGEFIYGIGDTTEIGDGDYAITHLPDGNYTVVVEPQSADYVEQTIENIAVSQDEPVQLNIALERAGVIREVDDSIGDDYGPGWYLYPTDQVFVDGSFDIKYVKIRDLSDSYQFEIGVVYIPDSSVVWWSPFFPPMNLEKIDIYVNCHSGGSRVALPNRNANFAATDAWDFAISVDGWWKGILASNGQDIFSNYTQDISSANFTTDTTNNRIFITVPKDAFVDNLGQADTSNFEQWDFLVLMLGHDGDGVEGVRSVNAGTNNQWQFNGGEDGDVDPNIIDVVAMPGLDQFGNPKEPGRTQEQMLDYTIETPVVLESHRSYDISPPSIDYEIPSSIEHLAGTKGVYIEVKIEDDVAVKSAKLYWRNIGETDWRTPIDLGFRELTNSFVGDIPYDLLSPDSFEFYFEAEDPSGNISYSPQDYADTSEPIEPIYPYSTESPVPTRVVPAITEIDTARYRIATNIFTDTLTKKFPDGTIITIDRGDVISNIDTINIEYANWDIPENFDFKSPDMRRIGRFRILKIFSENGLSPFDSPQFLSFHYFENPDSQFAEGDEKNFVVATLNNSTNVWISEGGANDISSNTIDFNFTADTSQIFGLFSAGTFEYSSEPISGIDISPNPFSPNGDGICDETNITLILNYDGNVDMDIFDINGEPIITLARNLRVSSGRNTNIIWDGTDDDGKICPMGIYLLSVRFKYVFEGNERYDRKNIAIVIIK